MEPESAYTRKCRMTWASLIKAVYEVDPLKCPKCGGTMKIISFIEDDTTIKKILKTFWQMKRSKKAIGCWLLTISKKAVFFPYQKLIAKCE